MKRSCLNRSVPWPWLVGLVLLLAVHPARVDAAGESRPYDEKLLRLSEILGSIHYLRELCAGSDGQSWRAEMQALIDSEGTSVLRKARLVASFNKGYRSFRRTYQACTPSAETAIARFMTEGAEIAEKLVETKPAAAAAATP